MFVKCPDCNATMHFRLDFTKYKTLEEWTQEHCPDTKPGEMPKMRCYRCIKNAPAQP